MTDCAQFIDRAKKIVGRDHCHTLPEQRAVYAYDAAVSDYMPGVVVFPADTAQVEQLVLLANKTNTPVTPRGAGTGMTGGSVAVCGGAVVVFSRMNRIISIDSQNLVACVQPGVITGKFQEAVEEKGLFYPPDPSSAAFSTIGGNVAQCAGGPRAVKYGVTRDYVLGLEAVTGKGEVISTGVKTAKGVVGYDLTRLIVGSAGTLALITRIFLRLLPLPESVRTLTAVFDRMEDAAGAVAQLFAAKIICRSIEYLDKAAIACAEKAMAAGLPTDAGALLLLEVDGDLASTESLAAKALEVCRQAGASQVAGLEDPERAKLYWKARKALSPALYQYGPHKINEDIVVPRNRIPQMVERINQIRERTGLTMVSFGHAGDGNIHVNIMLDKSDLAAAKKAEQAVEEIFDYTLELGGTISGEHGVGLTKAPYFSKEIGPASHRIMKEIKKVFDPNSILNPGKMP
jgi:glycolate oxidase